jgi:hypothetical protein
MIRNQIKLFIEFPLSAKQPQHIRCHMSRIKGGNTSFGVNC